MTLASPVLYNVTSLLACSRPEEETKSVLSSQDGLVPGWEVLVRSSMCMGIGRGEGDVCNMYVAVPSAPNGHGTGSIRQLKTQVCLVFCIFPHLGSAIWADCLTRPQYVERSY